MPINGHLLTGKIFKDYRGHVVGKGNQGIKSYLFVFNGPLVFQTARGLQLTAIAADMAFRAF